MWVNFAAVATGGSVGALARYGLTLVLPPFWGTWGVNILGCLLMGVVLASAERLSLPGPVVLLLATGFLGALTTFSTFEADAFSLLTRGDTHHWGAMVLYVLSSVVVGFIALFAGLKLTQTLLTVS